MLIRLLAALLLLPLIAYAQDRGWPAHYQNARGTPCCSIGKPGEDRQWDCARVAPEQGASLGIGSIAIVDMPSGPMRVTINSIFESETPDYIVCSPGCLFTHTGV